MSTSESTGRSPESHGAELRQNPLHTGISRVLAALGAGLDNGAERNLPAIFEREVRQLVEARDVRLREVPARYQARLVTPT